MDELTAQFQEVLHEVFDDDEIVLTRDMIADDVDGWDSLMHINLIIAVEQRFGIKFATAEISGLKDEDKNVGDFLDLVARKLDALA